MVQSQGTSPPKRSFQAGDDKITNRNHFNEPAKKATSNIQPQMNNQPNILLQKKFTRLMKKEQDLQMPILQIPVADEKKNATQINPGTLPTSRQEHPTSGEWIETTRKSSGVTLQ